jgi:hypothetical protein
MFENLTPTKTESSSWSPWANTWLVMPSTISAVIAVISFFIDRSPLSVVIVGCVDFDSVDFPAKDVGPFDRFLFVLWEGIGNSPINCELKKTIFLSPRSRNVETAGNAMRRGQKKARSPEIPCFFQE